MPTIVDIGGGGTKIASGTFQLGTSQMTIDIGFRAKYLTVIGNGGTNVNTYDADISTTTFKYSGVNSTTTTENFGGTGNSRLYGLSDTGFTINQRSSSQSSDSWYYAIGY